ncbi:MAG TPA: hypothetical protein VIJ39_10335 [Solirubrobacteraceae bacterium]
MTRPTQYRIGRLALAILTTTTLTLAAAGAALGASELNTYVSSSHFGREVNEAKTNEFKEPGNPHKVTEAEENVCTVSETCQPGKQSGEPGGVFFPESVAVGKNGNLYIAEKVNSRVQELGPEGKFILMFGWNVDKTKVEANAPQAERDVCTAASKDTCQSGEAWTAQRAGNQTPTGLAEQLNLPQDLAIDPETGNVYVLNFGYHRIDEYTEDGSFVLMFGREVNKTKVEAKASEAEQNVCTAASGDQCQSGVENEGGSSHSEIKAELLAGSLLSVGGPENLLYEGDDGRVQEFDAAGEWKGEVPLPDPTNGKVEAIAVDPAGDIFVADLDRDEVGVPGVYEYNAAGQLQRVIDKEGPIVAIAWDPHGRLGVIEREPAIEGAPQLYRGILYDPSGKLISEFNPLRGVMENSGPKGLAFSSTGALYIAQSAFQEIEAYVLGLFPGVRTCPAEAVGSASATLCGEINPNGLSARAYFLYEPIAGSRTPVAFEGDEEAFTLMHWQLTGLVPNELYRYRVFSEAEVNGKTESVTSEAQSLKTELIAPQVTPEIEASFVTNEVAVLVGSVNPEHASTGYHFEYGPCAKLAECMAARTTTEEHSSQYGAGSVAQEAGGLIPNTTYSYQLVASNEAGENESSEGTFRTAAPPTLTATTGAAGAITTTSAIITGAVDPGGQPATYTFQLGVEEGAATRYGVLFSGPLPASAAPLEEEYQLSGLQPGTTYTYRIAVASGYGSAEGAAATFTTAGLPSVLISPASLVTLPTPKITFPKAVKAKAPKPKKAGKKKRTAKKHKKGKGSAKKSARRHR